jgi:acetolactate synthase-1/2/3 large subunit
MSGSNIASVVAQYLACCDSRFVFAYPGDPIIEFMEQATHHDLQVVLARREGTAAFMAEAYGMLTGRPGVVLSTLGPGSTALVNGVAAATLDKVPVVAISGQVEPDREAYFTHQVVDHRQVFGPVTKWAARIEPAAVHVTMRKALRLATAERPGAVHLTSSGSTFQATTGGGEVAPPPLDSAAQTVQLFRAPGESGDLVTAIRSARRPVILAGTGAVRCAATAALTAFAELAGMPVVVAPMAKGVLPEDHPLFAGVLDMACNQLVWDFLAASDLIVAAGFDPVELIRPWSLSTPVVHVDTVPNIDQIYASRYELVGNVAAGLEWLASSWRGEPRDGMASARRQRDRLRQGYYAGRTPDRLNPTDVIDVARAAFPRETIVTTDVGSHKLLVGQGWLTSSPRTTLMTNGLSAMGFGVPAAIAAKLAAPERPVLALVGDGGFAMTIAEVRLAASLGLPVIFLVFVDGSLNRIELKQAERGYPSVATRLDDMDLVAMAGAMQCDGVRVESVSELEKCLSGVEGLSRPLVVEARIDPSQYLAQF